MVWRGKSWKIPWVSGRFSLKSPLIISSRFLRLLTRNNMKLSHSKRPQNILQLYMEVSWNRAPVILHFWWLDFPWFSTINHPVSSDLLSYLPTSQWGTIWYHDSSLPGTSPFRSHDASGVKGANPGQPGNIILGKMGKSWENDGRGGKKRYTKAFSRGKSSWNII